MTNQIYLKFASKCAREAGDFLKANFGRLRPEQIYEKGKSDYVTDLDRAVEQKYAEGIKKQFPDHGIIGEEGASVKTDAEYIWVIDPLDGTRNYIRKVPFFCTVLALLFNKTPVMGTICEPMTGDLYTAVKGEGSFCNGKTIHVSSVSDSAEASILYCYGRGAADRELSSKYLVSLKKEYRDISRFRSAGCEMAMVASGRAEAYILNGLPLWDLAAGALLVREAGGRVTTLKGREWKPGDPDMLVSNGTQLHEEILNLIK